MKENTGGQTTSPTERDLIERARELGPRLAERRTQADALRRLPDETVADIISAGLVKACQPRRVGGFELPFGAQTSAAAEIAKYCGSSAWIVSVFGSHHWMLGKFSFEAHDDVWGANPNALAASAFASTHQSIEAVDGGFKISGHWIFSSGIHASDWCIVLGRIMHEGRPPDMWFMLVPREDFDIQDSWRTVGLRGTGSHDLIVKDAFVPAHRAISSTDLNSPNAPGTKGNPNSIYSVPMSAVMQYCVAAPALGLAEGALETFTAAMGPRSDIFANRIAENTTLQLRTAESAAEIDCARLLYEDDIARARQSIYSATPPTLEDIARFKRNASYLGQLSKRATGRLAEAMGARGLNENNFVHKAYADIGAACSHISMVWDNCALADGKAKLGILTEADLGP